MLTRRRRQRIRRQNSPHVVSPDQNSEDDGARRMDMNSGVTK